MSDLKWVLARGIISSLIDFIEEDAAKDHPELNPVDIKVAKMFALGYTEGVTDEWEKQEINDHDMMDVAAVYKTGLELFIGKIAEMKKEERK